MANPGVKVAVTRFPELGMMPELLRNVERSGGNYCLGLIGLDMTDDWDLLVMVVRGRERGIGEIGQGMCIESKHAQNQLPSASLPVLITSCLIALYG